MSKLTVEHLYQIMPNAPPGDPEKELKFVHQVMKKFNINTKKRFAAFIANVAKESGELVYVEEIADGWDYEWRADLGNIYEGDGPRFKGHGYIQITGRNNHAKVAEALGIDCVNDPLLLTEAKWAWMSAGWYWEYGSSWGNLNSYADNNDFASTVLGVRGGPDADRWRYWHRAIEVLPDDLSLEEEEKLEPMPGPEPSIILEYDKEGWARDKATGIYIQGDKNLFLRTNIDGWLWKDPNETPPPPPKKWEWPVADVAPTSGDYVRRHPTRYNWLPERPDVEGWARYIVDKYPKKVWANTYYDHPEGKWRTKDSIDFWDWNGRGWPIDSVLGDRIFNLLFYHEGDPDIDWIIWRATIYGSWNNWVGEPFGSDGFSWHYDHIHVTYVA